MSLCSLLRQWLVRFRSWHQFAVVIGPGFSSGFPAELVDPEGYPLEEHTVQTQDGYLLSMYRVPAGASDNRKLQQAR